MKDMEAAICGLQREKEELNTALLSAKASAATNKSVDSLTLRCDVTQYFY